MARQILSLHWYASRWLLLPFVLAAFGLPILAVQGLGGDTADYGYRALDLVRASQALLPVFPALALSVGAVLALTAWSWDHRGEHVYALSLPVARWEYALLKLGAGMVLLAIPVAAFLVGSLLATTWIDLPEGLTAYPLEVSARFGLSALVMYAFLFAMAAGSNRTVIILLSTLVGVLILGELGIGLASDVLAMPWLEGRGFTETLFDHLTGWPGPFQVILGDWALIDV